jgi:hypothetical protein
MHPPDLSAVRRDLAEWSEPLIADCVSAFYTACFGGDQRRARPMTLQHCRLWRNLLLQDGLHAHNARRELVRLCQLTGLDVRILDRIDELVLDELIDVIAARFHRSPATARDYSRSLISAASSLTEARMAS